MTGEAVLRELLGQERWVKLAGRALKPKKELKKAKGTREVSASQEAGYDVSDVGG